MAQDNTDGTIVIDSQMFERLRLLVVYAHNELLMCQECDTFLVSLSEYLRANKKEISAFKSSRFLHYYLCTVPRGISEAIVWLKEAEEILDSIAVTKL
jgi:hypothetical protein